ncbi:MAG: DUF1488 domain-containing protein [Proteobacteria bacterium]|nr:DUF1488 domain-containing protein [Pseudomonadota bacterium]
MTAVNISEARTAPVRVGDGVMFLGTAGDAQQTFLISREALEDLARAREHVADLMPVFDQHRDHIAACAAKAMGHAPNAQGCIVLNSRFVGG